MANTNSRRTRRNLVDFWGFRYWQGAMQAWTNAWTRPVTSSFRLWEEIQGSEEFPVGKLVPATAALWSDWWSAVESMWMFPYQYCQGQLGHIPTVAFIIDTAAEAADPKEVAILPTLPDDITLASTDLTRMLLASERGGVARPDSIPSAKVTVELTGAGDHICVGLRNLRGTPESPEQLTPGHYIGIARTVETDCPLAVIHVIVEQAPENPCSTLID